jgi:hypothetical protein
MKYSTFALLSLSTMAAAAALDAPRLLSATETSSDSLMVCHCTADDSCTDVPPLQDGAALRLCFFSSNEEAATIHSIYNLTLEQPGFGIVQDVEFEQEGSVHECVSSSANSTFSSCAVEIPVRLEFFNEGETSLEDHILVLVAQGTAMILEDGNSTLTTQVTFSTTVPLYNLNAPGGEGQNLHAFALISGMAVLLQSMYFIAVYTWRGARKEEDAEDDLKEAQVGEEEGEWYTIEDI